MVEFDIELARRAPLVGRQLSFSQLVVRACYSLRRQTFFAGCRDDRVVHVPVDSVRDDRRRYACLAAAQRCVEYVTWTNHFDAHRVTRYADSSGCGFREVDGSSGAVA
jgi:hypothetical protein